MKNRVKKSTALLGYELRTLINHKHSFFRFKKFELHLSTFGILYWKSSDLLVRTKQMYSVAFSFFFRDHKILLENMEMRVYFFILEFITVKNLEHTPSYTWPEIVCEIQPFRINRDQWGSKNRRRTSQSSLSNEVKSLHVAQSKIIVIGFMSYPVCTVQD